MPSGDPLLKTRQVAGALGVSVSTIKRWVDAGELRASRTVGKHRLIALSEAFRFARSQGMSPSGLKALAGGQGKADGEIDAALCERLTEALRRGDARRGRGIIIASYAPGVGAAALADRLIRPVMERIGQAWESGGIDVFQEHEAFQIVASALYELNERASRLVRASAPVALGATPEGDPYLLPLLLGELVLREQGWDVRNLGVSLPLRSLSGAVLGYRPALVFLSVNVLTDVDTFAREYREFYETASAAGAAVVLGGRALGPGLRVQLDYTGFGDRMTHLTEFAKRFAPPHGLAFPTGGASVQPGSADSMSG